LLVERPDPATFSSAGPWAARGAPGLFFDFPGFYSGCS